MIESVVCAECGEEVVEPHIPVTLRGAVYHASYPECLAALKADRDRYRGVLVALRDAAARYSGDHSAESRALADAACKAAFAAVEETR